MLNKLQFQIITLSFFSFIFLLSLNSFAGHGQVKESCPENDKYAALDFPTGYNTLFTGSGNCITCHNSMVDSENNDIGIISWWSASMMANSAKDPFWRAKVSYESLKNPDLVEEIETTCLRCHAPMGVFDAFHNGQTHYSFAELDADPIAQDGVSCTACHQITDESLGNYSGDIEFGTNHVTWGPYTDVFANPMINDVGYTPAYGAHIKDSELCASCHTLLTPTIDLDGQPTGTYFVEQSIYQEWKNSDSFQNGISCQACHLPELDESIVISTMPPWLDGQTPFGLHELAGANVFMLKILKDNAEELGVNASDEDMDANIARTLAKLQEASINLELSIEDRDEDSLYLDVRIKNLAGHKVPGGYPSRQMFVQVTATDEEGNELFLSGEMDDEFNLIHENEDYEPHHQLINSEEQVQIYQLVMGDVEDNVTTTLLYADHQIKDNRLPPTGFVTTHPSYDTTEIVGIAEFDPTFNPNNEGGDLIKYHFPLNQYDGEINVQVKVFYQTVNNKWLEEMFSYSSPEIDAFHTMYNEADKQPILMQSENIVSQSTALNDINSNFSIYPNPTSDHVVLKENSSWTSVKIFQANGKYIREEQVLLNQANEIRLPDMEGVYFLKFEDKAGLSKTIKVLKI